VKLPNVAGLETGVPGDTLSTFSISYNNQTNNLDFKFNQLSTAGGNWPRHFAFNHRGDAVAVAAQKSNRVVIMARDINTGVIGNILSVVQIPSPTNLVWDEA
jgi:6-phosphogluconolactonase (cycloisomerase 2 family)